MTSALAMTLNTYLLQAVGNVLIALVLLRLWRFYRREYLRDWSCSWLALAIFHLLAGVGYWMSTTLDVDHPLRLLNAVAALTAGYWQLAWLARGTLSIAGTRRASDRLFWVVMACLVALAVGMTLAPLGAASETRLFVRVGLRALAAAAVLLAAAVVMFATARRHGRFGSWLLASAFLIYGLEQIGYFVVFALGLFHEGPVYLLPYTWAVDFLLQVAVGLGMTIQLLEGEQQNVRVTGRALDERHRLLQAVVEGLPDALFIKDLEGRYVLINTAGAHYLGKEPAEIIGRDDTCVMTPETVQAVQARDRAIVLSGQTNTEEVTVTASGVTRTYLSTKTPYRDGQGKIIGLIGVARDITGRKQIEAALRDSEIRYGAILNNAVEGFFQTTPEGAFRTLNPALARIYGYDSPDEVIAHFKDIGHQLYVDSQRRREFVRQIEAQGSVMGFEFEIQRKDGSQAWVSESTRAVRDATGKVCWYEGTVEDITMRKRAERRDLSRRQILEQIATGQPLPGILEAIVAFVEQESPDALCSILLLDPQRRHIVHGAAPRLPDFYNQAVNGLEIGPAVGSCGAAAYSKKRAIAKDIETDANWAPFRELARRAGLRSCWSEPILSSTNEVLGTFTVYHTTPQCPTPTEVEAVELSTHLASIAIERTQAEEALREGETFLRICQQAGECGSWEWELATNRMRWSDELCRIHGIAPAQSPKTLEAGIAFLHPDDRPRLKQGVPTALGTHKFGDSEYRIIRPDGEVRFLWGRGQIHYNSAGQPERVIGTVMDITERKRNEEERRKLEAQVLHAQKLESLGVLAGGIAHDFNNLLTAILGYADLARLESPPDSSLRANIDHLIEGAHRAAELTNQMLAYAGKSRSVLQPQNLSELVRTMAELLKVSISKKALLQCHLAAELPPIEADAGKLRQVIMNLIINASDALEDREGAITVRTEIARWDGTAVPGSYLSHLLPTGDYVVLEVADTGCGMSAEVQARIFEPFFTTKFTGRGLGLAAVLGIVHSHGGAIQVSSAPGRGTTFLIYFPISQKSAAEAAARPAVASWRGHGTILVVDDEDAIRGMAQRMLENLGFSVMTARDGRDAVAVFRAHADGIAAVLLDLTMPGLDAGEIVQELRGLRSHVRIVVSSGYGEQEARQRLGEHWLAGFVAKPYQVEELRHVFRRALEPEAEAR
jgi:PAS domain S-box-containing protein